MKWWPVFLLVLGLVGGGVALWARSATANKQLDAALLVSVKRADFPIDVLEVGKIQAREKVDVKSRVAGQVQRVLVREGDRVKKGDLLVELEPTDFRREVARTQAELAQAQNALDLAKLDLDRKKRAFADRAVAQAELDLALNDLRAKEIGVDLAKVALDAADDRLRYSRLTASLDGTVIERGIEPGEMVTPGIQATVEGKPLLTVADLSTLIAKVDLNQVDAAKVRIGQETTLTLDAIQDKTFKAVITKVAPAAIQPKSGEKDLQEVFPVEATLRELDDLIRPGMTADVRIHVETLSQVLSLPIEAVVSEGGKSFVQKVITKDGKQRTEKIEVVAGKRNERDVVLVSGASEGDKILVSPPEAKNEFK